MAITLTPKQRLEAYKFALESIKSDSLQEAIMRIYLPGICYYLDVYLSEILGFKTLTYSGLTRTFPEFGNQEPDHEGSNYWWPKNARGYLQRIAVLETCIAEVEKLLNPS